MYCRICCGQGNGGFEVTLEDNVLFTHPFNGFLEVSRQFGDCQPPPGGGNTGTDPPETTPPVQTTPPETTYPPETSPPETTPPETLPPCADIQLQVWTDNYAGDTSYELRIYSQYDVEQQQEQQQFQADDIWYTESGTLQNMSTYQEQICVDRQVCYQLGIFDTFGDGMLGPGSGVHVVYDGTVKFQGKDFGFGGYILMGYSCPGN
jgi:hypothetical protein